MIYDIHFGMRATRNQALYRNFYDANRQNLSEFQVVYDSLMITYNAHVDLGVKIKENVHTFTLRSRLFRIQSEQ